METITKNEKNNGLATNSSRYNMHPWSILPFLSSNFPILLVCGAPFRSEPYLSSYAGGISDSLWRVCSFHRKIEANQVVLAGSHNHYYRYIISDLSCFELFFWSISST